MFHDVTVTDYVPGYNPADSQTRSVASRGILDASSITCAGGFTCTSTYDVGTGLITWHLTGTGQDEGDLRDQSGTVSFVVRMPDLPQISPLAAPGVAFAGLMWNQAGLSWTQTDDPEEGGPHSSASNAVTDAANEVLPPAQVEPPQVQPPHGKPPQVKPPEALPNTGGPEAWILVAGLMLLLAGGSLVASDRRRRRS